MGTRKFFTLIFLVVNELTYAQTISAYLKESDSLYKEAGKLSIESGDISGRIKNNSRQAYTLLSLKRNDEALALIRENLNLLDGIRNSSLVFDVYNDYARILIDSGQNEKALLYINKALTLDVAKQNLNLTEIVYSNKVSALANLGRYKEAYLAKIEETKIKEQKLHQLDLDNISMQQLSIKAVENKLDNQKYFVLFSVGLIILLTTAIVYGFLNRQKSRYNKILENKIKIRTDELEVKNSRLEQEISFRIKAEEENKMHQQRLQSLLNVSQYKPIGNQDFLDFALNEAISLTCSNFGFIYTYNEETKQYTLNSWSHEVMNQCKVVEPKTTYDLDKSGIWGDAVRQRKPIVINDFQTYDTLKKGFPEGHIVLNNFLSIPVFRKNHIQAVIGVANKNSDYTDLDIAILSQYMDSVWGIIERQSIDELLTNYLHLNEKLIDSSIIGIIVYNSNGKCVLANESAAKSFGSKMMELLEQNFREIELWKSSGLLDYAEKALATGEIQKFESNIVISSGASIWIDGTFSLFELDNSRHLLFIFQDITERKLAEEKIRIMNNELQELINTKDKFFSIIAHDLRSPMHGLLGISQILKDEFESFPADETKKLLTSIYDIGMNIHKLLENLLNWSRIQTGRMEFSPERINLYTAVHQSLKLLSGVASQKSITINTSVDPELFVNADPNMIELILRNLISNAVKFSYNNSEIIFTAVKENGHVVMQVKDFGTGMPAYVLEGLFKADKNISQPGTNREHGSGLGLLLIKEMVNLHQGKITVESEEGKGSKFSVFLPV